jgi:hypothetical protein
MKGIAWLIARDSSVHDIIFKIGRYNGTPALSYLALWTLIKLTLPYAAMSYLSVALVCCAAAVFLRFRAISSGAEGFVHPRLFSCLSIRNRREELCFQCAVAVVGCEQALTICRSRLGFRAFLLPALLFVTAAAMAVIQARRAPDCSFVMEPTSQFFVIREIAHTLVVALATYRLAREAGHAALVLALCGVPAAFATIVNAQARHTGLVYLSWKFVMWISWPALRKLTYKDCRIVLVTFMFILIVQFYDALAAWMLDVAPVFANRSTSEAGMRRLRGIYDPAIF